MAPRTPPRILLVEDDIRQLILMRDALREAGYEVDTAQNLHESSLLLNTEPFPYAAILSDYNLSTYNRNRPGQYGTEVWLDAWYNNRNIPFLASSTEMEMWHDFAEARNDPNFHPIPKRNYNWDAPAVLAKLAELGVIP